MIKVFMVVLSVACMLGIGIIECGAEVSVDNMPPSVVKTIPQAGDTAVDPMLKEIRVTFSKDMMTKQMWSWCRICPQTFPEVDKNKIRYLKDKRTCVLPVKLKPGKTYVIWINTQRSRSFRDIYNHPAVPYLLVFRTAEKSSAKLITREIAAAEQWLMKVDNGRYAASWNEAAPYFKSAISQKKWEQVARAARGPLGKLLARNFMSKNHKKSLPGAPDGNYMIIQFRSSFVHKKSAVETITLMHNKDGQWRVAGYFIR